MVASRRGSNARVFHGSTKKKNSPKTKRCSLPTYLPYCLWPCDRKDTFFFGHLSWFPLTTLSVRGSDVASFHCDKLGLKSSYRQFYNEPQFELYKPFNTGKNIYGTLRHREIFCYTVLDVDIDNIPSCSNSSSHLVFNNPFIHSSIISFCWIHSYYYQFHSRTDYGLF